MAGGMQPAGDPTVESIQRNIDQILGDELPEEMPEADLPEAALYTIPKDTPILDKAQLQVLQVHLNIEKSLVKKGNAERQQTRKAAAAERAKITAAVKAQDVQDQTGRIEKAAVKTHTQVQLTEEQIKVAEDEKVVSVAFAMLNRPAIRYLVIDNTWMPLAAEVQKIHHFRAKGRHTTSPFLSLWHLRSLLYATK
jgi:hypothetical protein